MRERGGGDGGGTGTFIARVKKGGGRVHSRIQGGPQGGGEWGDHNPSLLVSEQTNLTLILKVGIIWMGGGGSLFCNSPVIWYGPKESPLVYQPLGGLGGRLWLQRTQAFTETVTTTTRVGSYLKRGRKPTQCSAVARNVIRFKSFGRVKA